MEKIAAPEMGKSLIMPAVTVQIPMPQGAAVPAQAPQAPAQAPQAAPAHASAQRENR
jgi:hypothetical protein